MQRQRFINRWRSSHQWEYVLFDLIDGSDLCKELRAYSGVSKRPDGRAEVYCGSGGHCIDTSIDRSNM